MKSTTFQAQPVSMVGRFGSEKSRTLAELLPCFIQRLEEQISDLAALRFVGDRCFRFFNILIFIKPLAQQPQAVA